MRGRIITSRHETWELPELLSWELLRTGSVPCDSFEALCPYTAEMAEAAHLAVSFLLLEGERLLLHGIVDEVVTEETAMCRASMKDILVILVPCSTCRKLVRMKSYSSPVAARVYVPCFT